jgi:hypothetical protein
MKALGGRYLRFDGHQGFVVGWSLTLLESSTVPPPEIHVFEPQLIRRGPDEIRGQVDSLAFIFTKYPDPGGNRWFVRPGFVGHERMTNSPGMLQALFGPEPDVVAEQVVTVGDVYTQNERGHFIPTGQKREVYDWYEIRRRSKRANLYGRAGKLNNRDVVMLWPGTDGWETMLVEVLNHLGIGPESEAVVVVGNSAQYMARDFFGLDGTG